MATPDEYINQAAQYIGVSGTDNIFNTWIWGHHCYDPNVYPWCAAFQSYVGVHDLDMPFSPSASAAGVAWQGERVYGGDVQRGDWVLFNWDGRADFSWADHIGVVEWFDHASGYFGTIEGNCNDVVTRVTRTIYGGYSTAFFRPPYKDEPTPTKKGDKKMECLIRPNGEFYMVYFDGTKAHKLLHPDEMKAIQWCYSLCNNGAEIPCFEFGTKSAPWATRLFEGAGR